MKEYNYNSVMEGIRKDVECCFGIMKKCWRCLKNPMRYRSIKVCHKVFVTTCIVHNLMVDMRTSCKKQITSTNTRNNGVHSLLKILSNQPISYKRHEDVTPTSINTRSCLLAWKKIIEDINQNAHFCVSSGALKVKPSHQKFQ